MIFFFFFLLFIRKAIFMRGRCNFCSVSFYIVCELRIAYAIMGLQNYSLHSCTYIISMLWSPFTTLSFSRYGFSIFSLSAPINSLNFQSRKLSFSLTRYCIRCVSDMFCRKAHTPIYASYAFAKASCQEEDLYSKYDRVFIFFLSRYAIRIRDNTFRTRIIVFTARGWYPVKVK